MITFLFTKNSFKQFEKIENLNKNLIKEKLKILKNTEQFLKNSKKLKDLKPATHRIRAGRYRLLLKKESSVSFIILKIAHGQEIYK